jgi:hypothetical protein
MAVCALCALAVLSGIPGHSSGEQLNGIAEPVASGASALTPQDATEVATGSFPTCNSATWTLTSDGVLAFAGTGTVTDDYSDGSVPWASYAVQITSVSFTGDAVYEHPELWFRGCTSLTSITLPTGFGTDTTSLMGLFSNCSALTSIALPAGFGQNATDASRIFLGCSALTSITLPDGFGQKAQDMSYLFDDCAALQTLDLSEASTAASPTMEGIFENCASLDQVKLGANWSFKDSASGVLGQLSDPPAPASLWRAVGSGTVAAPLGAVYSATDLASSYTGTMADTYVWRTALAGSVAINATPAIGATLTADVSGMQADATASYAWYSAPDAASAGTKVGSSLSYTVAASDAGAYLYMVVSDTAGLYSGSFSSSHTAVQGPLSGSLVLSNPCGVGYDVTATGSNTPDSATLSFTWYVADDATSDGTQVSTDSSYTPVVADFGKYLYATASDSSGAYTGSIVSPHTVIVAAGTFPSCATASWTLTPDGTITFAGSGTVREKYANALDLPWYPYSSVITSAVFTGNVSYTWLRYWLFGCTNLSSVSMPEGFGSSATGIDLMFGNCLNLVSLALPNGFGSQAVYASEVFSNCKKLASLSLPTGFGHAKSMDSLFSGCSSLVQVTLGSSWTFKGAGSTVLCQFPNPVSSSLKWCAVGAGTVASPLGAGYTVADLASSYTGSMADTYVLATSLIGRIAVPSSFEAGKAIHVRVSDAQNDATPVFTWYEASDATSPGTVIATGNTYTPTVSDARKYLYVTATDSSGKYAGSVSSSRSMVKPVLSGSVSISGPALVNSALTFTLSDMPSDATLSYSWRTATDAYMSLVEVGTGPTYTPDATKYGKHLFVEVSDTSGTYSGVIDSAELVVTAPISVTVPTSATLSVKADGTITGPQISMTNTSAIGVYASSLSATPAAPFSLVASSAFDAASGQNELSLALSSDHRTTMDLADYQSPLLPTMGEWNLSANGGSADFSISGKLKNATVALSDKNSVHALDLSWSFEAGLL